MPFLKLLGKWLLETDEQQPRRAKRSYPRPSRAKRFIVQHQGRKKSYRVNKYGEIFEE